jgi:hypothetical protein
MLEALREFCKGVIRSLETVNIDQEENLRLGFGKS